MASLAFLVGLYAAQFATLVAASVWTARRMRAANATWRRGAAITAIILVLQLLGAAVVLIPARLVAIVLVAALLALALQVVAAFVVVRRGFGLGFGRSWVVVGSIVAVFVAFYAVSVMAVRPYAIESFIIPTESMSPTIEPGDCVIACKLLTPRRWDLVVYWSPEYRDQRFCKRLVGLPGERLRFESGTLYVNEVAETPPPVLAGKMRASPPTVPGRYRDGQTIALGPDEVFVVGDNLDFSIDSRLEGPAPVRSVVGVADIRYWPVGRMGLLR